MSRKGENIMSNANSATYLPRYTLTALDGEAAIEGLTLYEAVKALTDAAARGVVKDATHIRRDGRCVAFWCAWNNAPRGMFGAHEDEKYLVNEWAA